MCECRSHFNGTIRCSAYVCVSRTQNLQQQKRFLWFTQSVILLRTAIKTYDSMHTIGKIINKNSSANWRRLEFHESFRKCIFAQIKCRNYSFFNVSPSFISLFFDLEFSRSNFSLVTSVYSKFISVRLHSIDSILKPYGIRNGYTAFEFWHYLQEHNHKNHFSSVCWYFEID